MSSITEADDHNYYFKFRFALVYFKKKQNTSTKQKKVTDIRSVMKLHRSSYNWVVFLDRVLN